MLALALLPVVIMGGVDISFVAIAVVASYPIHIFLYETLGHEGGIVPYYLLSIPVGISVGLLIAFLLNTFKLDIFELSLGMNTLIYGFIRFFVSTNEKPVKNDGLVEWHRNYIIEVESVVGGSGLHISILTLLVIGILLFLFLRYTTTGRSVYAIGSDKNVAIRTGFNVNKTFYIVFAIMGMISAIAGVTQGALILIYYPFSFIGKEVFVLAFLVMGGASLTGGKGSVIGAFLGAILLGVLNQALVYLNISTQWYDAFVGTMFIVYAIIRSQAQKLTKQKQSY
jgi:simple sugar transport system permease protein